MSSRDNNRDKGGAHNRDENDLNKVEEIIENRSQRLPRLSEDFFDSLESQIMARVEKTEIKNPPRFKKPKLKSHHLWLGKGAAAVVAGAMIFSVLSHFKGPNTQWDVSRQMAAQAHENVDDLSGLMTYQNEHDFFVDVASQSLDHLTKEQFRDLIASTKTR